MIIASPSPHSSAPRAPHALAPLGQPQGAGSFAGDLTKLLDLPVSTDAPLPADMTLDDIAPTDASLSDTAAALLMPAPVTPAPQAQPPADLGAPADDSAAPPPPPEGAEGPAPAPIAMPVVVQDAPPTPPEGAVAAADPALQQLAPPIASPAVPTAAARPAPAQAAARAQAPAVAQTQPIPPTGTARPQSPAKPAQGTDMPAPLPATGTATAVNPTSAEGKPPAQGAGAPALPAAARSAKPAMQDASAPALAAAKAAPAMPLPEVAAATAPLPPAPTSAQTTALASAPASQPLAMASPDWPSNLAQTTITALTPEGGTMVMTLAPDDLGSLRITLTLNGDAASLQIIAETPEVAQILTQAEGQLAQEFARNGITLTAQETTTNAPRLDAGHDPQTGGNAAGRHGNDAQTGANTPRADAPSDTPPPVAVHAVNLIA